MKIAIVDDEAILRSATRTKIETFLKETALNAECFDYASAEDFLKACAKHEFDILVLDIQLPGQDGVSLAQQLSVMEYPASIIFLTSYEHYMRDAFGLNIFRYILKKEVDLKLIDTLHQLIQLKQKQASRMIHLFTPKGEQLINEDDLVCIVIIQREFEVYTRKNRFNLKRSYTLKELTEKLSPESFIQANSGVVVNMNYIREYTKKAIRLEHYPELIQISRPRQKEFFEQYRKFMIQGDFL